MRSRLSTDATTVRSLVGDNALTLLIVQKYRDSNRRFDNSLYGEMDEHILA